MKQFWNILVVDDEEDVHLITKLALKHKLWTKRGFRLTSAFSAKEAMEKLEDKDADYHVALVDVVMENVEAGLKLCKHIRETCKKSLRIVLRTGQAGSAPEDVVLNEYDIDYYLSKAEVTEQKLFSVVRACLRSSQDIETLLAFGKQLQSFTRALQSASTLHDLLVLMGEGLKFLELKFNAKTLFYFDLQKDPHGDTAQLDGKTPAISAAMAAIHDRRATPMELIGGAGLGLPSNSFLIPFEVTLEDDEGKKGGSRILSGLYAEISPDLLTEQQVVSFRHNAILFLDNWRIAYSTLLLQERVARDRLLKEKMYFERMQSIATMVTGVSHEINTPLGVASTANSMIGNIIRRAREIDMKSEDGEELLNDLNESSSLMTKNILRAHKLIESFKKLSAGQLSDQRQNTNLRELIGDCMITMAPVTKKQQLNIVLTASAEANLAWDGYPGHLTQVLVNLIQNALRYAYPNQQGGKIDIRLIEFTQKELPMFRVEFEDYGKGVPPEIFKSLFQPFVTSGRELGGTGLGLAISQNIVTNLLKGKISCVSELGKGAKFVIEIPQKVVDSPTA